MDYRVLLRRNADGAERWSDHTQDDKYMDALLFSWMDNNFSCDCNRGSVFDATEAMEHPCGSSRYTVVRLELPDGRWASDAEPEWHVTPPKA